MFLSHCCLMLWNALAVTEPWASCSHCRAAIIPLVPPGPPAEVLKDHQDALGCVLGGSGLKHLFSQKYCIELH